MATGRKVPDVVVRRLALYFRTLQEMDLEYGHQYVSSKELGQRAGVTPVQVRKDLALFGEFGKQGVGYQASYLREELRRILNSHRKIPVGLVGAGELGMALTRYVTRRFLGTRNYPFQMVALFDNDPAKIGRAVEGVKIFGLEEIAGKVKELKIKIILLTVPAAAAQEAADRCIRAGVRALLNFAPTKLVVPPGVRLQHSDVSLELQQLAYHL